MMSWIPPPTNFLKLNTDGVAKKDPQRAGGGGLLIRDSDEEWILGFYLNFRYFSNVISELSSIRFGLQLAWDRCWKFIIFETNAAAIISLIQTADTRLHSLGPILEECRELLHRNLTIILRHTYREAI